MLKGLHMVLVYSSTTKKLDVELTDKYPCDMRRALTSDTPDTTFMHHQQGFLWYMEVKSMDNMSWHWLFNLATLV